MTDAEFEQLVTALKAFKRVAICGGHGVGKNYLAANLTPHSIFVVDTDEHLDGPLKCGFEEVPGRVLLRLGTRDRFIVCGAQVARLLRGSRDGTRPPLKVDAAVWLSKPYLPQSKGHKTQTKGLRTVWDDWRRRGLDKGVEVFER